MPPVYVAPRRSLHKKLHHAAKHPRAKGVLLAVLVALYVLYELSDSQVWGATTTTTSARVHKLLHARSFLYVVHATHTCATTQELECV